MIIERSSSETLQQNGAIVIFKFRCRDVTRMEPRDSNSRALAGKAADRHDMLHVYGQAGEDFPV